MNAGQVISVRIDGMEVRCLDAGCYLVDGPGFFEIVTEVEGGYAGHALAISAVQQAEQMNDESNSESVTSVE